MSIATNIKRLREIFDLTQADLAEVAGVTKNAVSQWENGRAEPRMGAIERMAACSGITKSHIIEDGGMDLIDPVTRKPRNMPSGAKPVRGTSAMVPLRVLGATHAGERMDEDESDYMVEFPRSVAERHPGCFALRVEGDCMNRRYPEGCHIMVDPNMEPRNGSAVVAEFEDGRSVLRNYLRGSSTLMLTADSFAEHEDIIVTLDDPPVRTVGVVVWYQADKETE